MAAKWTTKLVAERLDEAASTMRRLPPVVPRGYFSFWPSIIHDVMEAYGWNEAVLRLGPPTPEAISRMDEVMEWLRWLEPNQVRLVWLRATRTPWKVIVFRFACDRTTAWRKWNIAINSIASRLESREEKCVAT